MNLKSPISIDRRSVERGDLPPKRFLVIQIVGRRFHLEYNGRPKLVLQDPENAAVARLQRLGGIVRLVLLILSTIGMAGVVTNVPYAWPILGVSLILLTVTKLGKLEIATPQTGTVGATGESTMANVVETENEN